VTEPSGATSRSVLIVINALHSGGAERSCIELIRSLKASHRIEVVSLLGGGPAEQAFMPSSLMPLLRFFTWRIPSAECLPG
jgi:hypothetical protein